MADPFPNHNGGDLQFGPDGDLYIGTGDGGSAGDPGARSQNVKVPLGKLLRIDVDRHPSGRPYGIPADNPFATNGKGLRLRLRVGPAQPVALLVRPRRPATSGSATSGRTRWEEVDHVAKGKGLAANFGWSHYEGTHSFNPAHALTSGGHLVWPVAQYTHTLGCSITGGYVYRGPSIPSLDGRYVYADYCSARMWTIAPGSKTPARRHQLRERRRAEDARELRRGHRRHALRALGAGRAVPLRRPPEPARGRLYESLTALARFPDAGRRTLLATRTGCRSRGRRIGVIRGRAAGAGIIAQRGAGRGGAAPRAAPRSARA